MKTKPKSYGVEYTPTHMRFPCDHCHRQIEVTWDAMNAESIKEAEKQAQLGLIEEMEAFIGKNQFDTVCEEGVFESFYAVSSDKLREFLEEKKASILQATQP